MAMLTAILVIAGVATVSAAALVHAADLIDSIMQRENFRFRGYQNDIAFKTLDNKRDWQNFDVCFCLDTGRSNPRVQTFLDQIMHV